ncbi:MAG: peptidylprolyl isomerase [Mycobacteriales bacterium]
MPTTKQRRETARRRLERQIQRRQQAAAARRRRNLVTAAALGVVLVLGGVFLLVTRLGGDDAATTAAPTPTPTPSASAAVAGDCTYTKSQEKATRNVGVPPNGKVPTAGTVTVDVTTSRGPMTFSLDRAKAPCAVASFAYLAGKKFYDGTPCHRLTTGPNFGVLQCGDPGGTGSGGPGYRYADEVTPDLKYTKGVLAMANSGADTNGSQFFIVYKDTQLQPKYTVFGTVTKGLPVVEAVAKGGSDGANGADDGKPKLPVTITKMQVASSS